VCGGGTTRTEECLVNLPLPQLEQLKTLRVGAGVVGEGLNFSYTGLFSPSCRAMDVLHYEVLDLLLPQLEQLKTLRVRIGCVDTGNASNRRASQCKGECQICDAGSKAVVACV
jgi:hypothetical protein